MFTPIWDSAIMPATTRMVTDSVVRTSGRRVRNRADRAACASLVRRARCRSIAALTASQTATATKMVTASDIRLDSARRPGSVSARKSKVPSPQSWSSAIAAVRKIRARAMLASTGR